MELSVAGRPAYAYTGGHAHDPAAPALVMVHGGANDHSVWGLQSRWFAHHGYRVLVPDLPGHGRTPGPALESIEAVGAWLIAAMDAAGIATAALVGHSMGSLVALEAAGAAPERVTRLALIGTAFPMRVSAELLEAARDDEPRAHRMINAWAHNAWAHYPGSPAPGFWVRGVNLRLMQRQPPGTLHADFAACDRYAGAPARARAVRCPVGIVLSRRDAMTAPRSARELANSFAEVRLFELETPGHALMAEAPEEVLAALRSLLG